MKREVQLIYAMDTQKQNASSILDKRKKEAEALRLKTISVTKMKDSEVNQLKADIKVSSLSLLILDFGENLLTVNSKIMLENGVGNDVFIYIHVYDNSTG